MNFYKQLLFFSFVFSFCISAQSVKQGFGCSQTIELGSSISLSDQNWNVVGIAENRHYPTVTVQRSLIPGFCYEEGILTFCYNKDSLFNVDGAIPFQYKNENVYLQDSFFPEKKYSTSAKVAVTSLLAAACYSFYTYYFS